MKVYRPKPLNQQALEGLRLRRAWFPWGLTVTCGAYALLIFLCTWFYNFGSVRGFGLVKTFNPVAGENAPPLGSTADWFDCLHFSVTTITTLGYGDLRPVRWSRIVSDSEAVLGTVLIGVFISQLVSRQQDRRIRRLVKGQMNAEILRFRELIQDRLENWKAFGQTSQPEGSVVPLTVQQAEVLSRTAGLARTIFRYWRNEAKEPDLYYVTPHKIAERMQLDFISLLECIAEFLAPYDGRTIGEPNRIHLRNVAESFLMVSIILREAIGQQGIVSSSSKVDSLVTALRKKFRLTNPRSLEAPRVRPQSG